MERKVKSVQSFITQLSRFTHPAEQDHCLASKECNVRIFKNPVAEIVVRTLSDPADKDKNKVVIVGAAILVGVDYDQDLEPVVALVGTSGRVEFTLGRKTEISVSINDPGFNLVILNPRKMVTLYFVAVSDAHELRVALNRIQDVLIF